MALPADFQTGTVTGRYKELDGSAAVGTVEFTPVPTRMVSPATETIVLGETLSVQLDEDGEFSIELPATNDPDITPTDFSYKVVERFTNGKTYFIEVPVGGTVDLSTVSPVDPTTGTSTIVRTAATETYYVSFWDPDHDAEDHPSPIAVDLSELPTSVTTVLLEGPSYGAAIFDITMPSAEREPLTIVGEGANFVDDVTLRFPGAQGFRDQPTLVGPDKLVAAIMVPSGTPVPMTQGTWLVAATNLGGSGGGGSSAAPVPITGRRNADGVGSIPNIVIGDIADDTRFAMIGLVAPLRNDTWGILGMTALGHDPTAQDIPTTGWVFQGTGDVDSLYFILPYGFLPPEIIGQAIWVQQRYADATGRSFYATLYVPNIPAEEDVDTVDFDAWLIMGDRVQHIVLPPPDTPGDITPLIETIIFNIELRQYGDDIELTRALDGVFTVAQTTDGINFITPVDTGGGAFTGIIRYDRPVSTLSVNIGDGIDSLELTVTNPGVGKYANITVHISSDQVTPVTITVPQKTGGCPISALGAGPGALTIIRIDVYGALADDDMVVMAVTVEP